MKCCAQGMHLVLVDIELQELEKTRKPPAISAGIYSNNYSESACMDRQRFNEHLD